MARELTPSEYEHAVAAGRAGNTGNKNYVKAGAVTVAAVVLCGISFVGGMAYGKDHAKPSSVNTGGQFGFQGGNGPGGFRAGQRPNIGEVKAVSSDSITVSNAQSGSDQAFKITSGTTVENNGATGAVSDIKTGDTVVIQTDSSDSSTATRIILNPNLQGPESGTSTQSL